MVFSLMTLHGTHPELLPAAHSGHFLRGLAVGLVLSSLFWGLLGLALL